MKKIYEKPEIEAVSYAANTSLCGSCDASAMEDLATLGELLFDDPYFFTSRKGSGYFQNGECIADIIEAPGAEDWYSFYEAICKFTAGAKMFIS